MKKLLTLLLALTLILSLSACGGSDGESSDTEKKTDENLTAYEYYDKAVKNFEEADSYDVDMLSKFDVKSLEINYDMEMGGNIKSSGVNVDDRQFVIDLHTKGLGTDSTMKGFYVDGYTYAEEDGEKRKSKVDVKEFDSMMNINPVKITSDMIEDQSVEEVGGNKELHMKLSEAALDQVTFGMVGKINSFVDDLSLDGDLTLKSLSFVVTITEDVELSDLILTASYNVAADGEAGTMTVTFNEKFNQIGGVELDIPSDLSAYKE